MHGTSSPALIYVISPAGDVIRKLRIDAGDPDLVARRIRSHAGRLAIQFDRWSAPDSQESVIIVTDLRGNPTVGYKMGAVVDGENVYLAGFASDGLTFSPYMTKDQLYLVKAKLQ